MNYAKCCSVCDSLVIGAKHSCFFCARSVCDSCCRQWTNYLLFTPAGSESVLQWLDKIEAFSWPCQGCWEEL